MGAYRLITTWEIRAPRDQVWAALYDVERYPAWWPGIAEVELLRPAGPDGTGKHVRITMRSRLPYWLQFETIGRVAQQPDRIVVDAVGELEGSGSWDLEQTGDVTTAVYTWEVVTTKPWMNALRPFAAPLFVWNHHVVMRWGAQGLARHLEAELVGEQSIPSVRPVDLAPLAGLLAGVVAVVVLAGRRAE